MALVLSLACSACATAAPPAHAQQTSAHPGAFVYMLVTRTRAEADAALRALRAGKDFAVLAKERSVDASGTNGGYLGPLDRAPLTPDLRATLKTISAGELTPVVPVQGGYAVLAILANAPPTDLDARQIQALASAAIVRQSINVAGMSEEDAVFAQYPKPDGWGQDLREPCAIRKQAHSVAVARMEHLIAAGGATAPLDLLRDHVALAQLHAFTGDLDGSVREWQSAYKIAQASVPGAMPYLEEALGVTYLHRSEERNGVYQDNGSMDIFPPLSPGAHYADTHDSKSATDYLEKFLDRAPTDLQAKWLLNLTYMTLGQYPAGVPPKSLVPEGAFESTESVGRFTDVAHAAGLDVFSAAGGVIVEDFDNDGYLDVMTSSVDVCDPLHYFHNNGDGTFTDQSIKAGLADQLGGLNLIQADYNNDGCMDVLVLRGGWEFPIRKSLLRNNCDGTFTDVTRESGLGAATATQTAAWADIDNDGYVDLFVGNENAPSQLFRNRGDGTFEDISHAAGIDRKAFTKGVVAADYDKDGYVDFYVSNFQGANFLYHNNGDLTFTDVARQAGVEAPYLSFATWFFDYDNDGWPDIFVTSYYSYTVDQVLRSYLGLPFTAETLKLYRNLHNGAFEDVTARVGLNKVYMPMGANFGDIDNDGYLDLYLGMGQPSFATLLPHVLLRNHGGTTFVDVTASSGTGELHKGHGIAFADLERNGQEDIIAEIGGSVPSDKHTMRVYRNPGNANDWINLRLAGVKSNRAALGAEIKLTVSDDGGPARYIYRTVGDTSSFGSNPMEQHIGLGHAARILRMEIDWPASGTHQQFTHVQVDTFLGIKEFDTSYTTLERKISRLGQISPTAAAR